MDLTTLQETATTTRASADELKAALTDESTDEDRATADAAEATAVEAETALSTAKAAAEEGADGSGESAAAAKVGDVCQLPDNGGEGVLKDTSEAQDDSQLTCVAKEEPAADDDLSRTGYVEGQAKTGDACVCPDGRAGTVTVFAGNMAVCLPNQG